MSESPDNSKPVQKAFRLRDEEADEAFQQALKFHGFRSQQHLMDEIVRALIESHAGNRRIVTPVEFLTR